MRASEHFDKLITELANKRGIHLIDTDPEEADYAEKTFLALFVGGQQRHTVEVWVNVVKGGKGAEQVEYFNVQSPAESLPEGELSRETLVTLLGLNRHSPIAKVSLAPHTEEEHKYLVRAEAELPLNDDLAAGQVEDMIRAVPSLVARVRRSLEEIRLKSRAAAQAKKD